MQIYALKMFNFFRYREDNASIVFDMLPEYKGMSLDDLYEKVRKDPLEHIKKVKVRGITNITSIAGVIGDNFDSSNGAGKSTILEAIAYVLFEQLVRTTANSDKTGKAIAVIATQINGKFVDDMRESYVEIIFEENNKVYILKRGRSFTKNHKSHTRMLKFDCVNESEVDSQSGHRTRDTDEAVASVINMSYDVFANSILFGQQDIGKFLMGTDGVRKAMLISLLQLDTIVQGLIEKVREQRKNKKIEIDGFVSQLTVLLDEIKSKPSTESLLQDINNKEKETQRLSLESEEYRKRIDDLNRSDSIKKLEEIKQEGIKIRNELREKQNQKESRKQEWLNLVRETESSIINKSKDIEEIKRKILSLNDKISADKKNIESFNMEVCKEELEKVEKAKQVKPKYVENLTSLRTVKEKIIESISSAETELNRISKEIILLQEQILNAGNKNEFVCDKCKSVVSRKHIDDELGKNEIIKKDLQDKVKKHKEERLSTEESISKCQERVNKIEEWLLKEGKIKLAISNFNNSKERIVESEKNIKESEERLVKTQSEKQESEDKKKQYGTKITEIEKTYENEINKLTDDLNILQIQYKEIEKSSSEIRNQIETLKNQIENISKNKAIYNSNIGSMKKEIEHIEQLSKRVNNIKTKVDEENVVLNRLVLLDSVCGLDGIQTRIISKYLPLLNVYIKEFMTVLSDGFINFELIINEKSCVDIVIKGASASGFDMLSGGEKTIVKMATSVSLALLSFTRCNQKPEFIAIDELFGSLDAAHVESAFRLLKKIQDKFSRVLIISHNPEINERIPHRILVEKSEGIYGRSQIKEIT